MTLPTIKGDQPVILPGQTIGIIGGGQLGRMMAIAARYMGYRIIVLDPTPNCPTGQIADDQIVAAYDDMAAIRELTRLSDVDRKSTRLNSSHVAISYAVLCL